MYISAELSADECLVCSLSLLCIHFCLDVLHSSLDCVLSEHAAMQLDRRQGKMLGNVTVGRAYGSKEQMSTEGMSGW